MLWYVLEYLFTTTNAVRPSCTYVRIGPFFLKTGVLFLPGLFVGGKFDAPTSFYGTSDDLISPAPREIRR